MNNKKQLLNELKALRELSLSVAERAYNAIVQLEQVPAPAPNGGKTQRPVITHINQHVFVQNIKKSLRRKTHANS